MIHGDPGRGVTSEMRTAGKFRVVRLAASIFAQDLALCFSYEVKKRNAGFPLSSPGWGVPHKEADPTFTPRPISVSKPDVFSSPPKVTDNVGIWNGQ